jgi:site-specific recombinase XerD
MQMQNLIDEYISYLGNNERLGNTQATYAVQLKALDRFLQKEYSVSLCKEQIQEVQGHMLNAYYATWDVLPDTKNQYVKIIQWFFKFVKGSGYITTDPSEVLRLLKKKRKHEESIEEIGEKVYTPEEVIAIMHSDAGRNKLRNAAIVALLAGSALRASEVAELTISQFRKMERGMIYCHRKGDIWRWVAIADYAVDYILQYLATRDGLVDEAPLFKSALGGFMDRKSVWSALATRQKAEGVKTGVHIFRHTALTHVNNVAGELVAMETASHQDKKTTGIYFHTTAKERLDAVNSLPWAQKEKEGV